MQPPEVWRWSKMAVADALTALLGWGHVATGWLATVAAAWMSQPCQHSKEVWEGGLGRRIGGGKGGKIGFLFRGNHSHLHIIFPGLCAGLRVRN